MVKQIFLTGEDFVKSNRFMVENSVVLIFLTKGFGGLFS